jgi:DNA-binding protein
MEGQKDENTIYVGKKSVMSYVLAVVTQFNQGAPEVKLKARGRSISVAVDASQITKNRFIPNLQFKEIKLGTEELTSEDGSMNKVSSIEIVMTKE